MQVYSITWPGPQCSLYFYFPFGNNSQIKTGLRLTNWKRFKIMLGLGVIALVLGGPLYGRHHCPAPTSLSMQNANSVYNHAINPNDMLRKKKERKKENINLMRTSRAKVYYTQRYCQITGLRMTS